MKVLIVGGEEGAKFWEELVQRLHIGGNEVHLYVTWDVRAEWQSLAQHGVKINAMDDDGLEAYRDVSPDNTLGWGLRNFAGMYVHAGNRSPLAELLRAYMRALDKDASIVEVE